MEGGDHKVCRAQGRVRTITKKRIEYERTQPQQNRRADIRKNRRKRALVTSVDMVNQCNKTLECHGLAQEPGGLDCNEEASVTDLPSADSNVAPEYLFALEVVAEEADTNHDDKDDTGVLTSVDFDSLLRDADAAPERVPELVQAIFHAMAANVKDIALQSAGVQALEQFASAGPHKAVALAGGTQTLLSLADMHRDVEVLQELLCKVLRAVIVCGLEFRASVASSGGVRVVLSSMTAHPKSVSVQLAAGRALKELAAHSPAIQDEICSHRGIEAVLSAMQLHPTDAAMQEVGCGALRNLSAGSPKRQMAIAAHDGVRLVLAAMSLHSQHEVVQWAGCWAIFCLTLQNVELQARVVASGGLQLVLQAMSGHRASSRVQEAGCWAIKLLSTTVDPDLSLSARGAVFLAMQSHPLDQQVQKAGRAASQSVGVAKGLPPPHSIPRTRIVDPGPFANPSTRKSRKSGICGLATIAE